MATPMSMSVQNFLARLNVTQIAAPGLILMILAMMVLPLPAFILDAVSYTHLTLPTKRIV